MHRKRPRDAVGRLIGVAVTESYLVLLVGAAASLLLLGIGVFVTPDTWLALVSGRVVAAGGPPSTDTLTAWTLGRDWLDQQWLGQLLLYELWRAGALALVGLVHVAIVVATFLSMLIVARRRGGSSRHVALVGLLATLPIGLIAGNIRAQTFAFPLFVAVLWLLSRHSRAPSTHVLWCFPLLVGWANTHGSVVLGAGLVALAGGLQVLQALRSHGSWSQKRLGVVMIAMAPASLLATPYGPSLFSYFRDIFGNPEIGKIASDWMPTVLKPIQLPFYLLAALTLVLLGRARLQLTAFEQLALVLLLAAALTAARNLAWFALAAVLLTPPLLTRRGRPDADRPPPPKLLAATVSGVVVLLVVAAAVRGVGNVDRQVASRFPPAAVEVVARETDRDPSLGLLTHPRYADWLLFEHPPLAGRVPFDIRYELLTPAELRRFRRFRHQIGADWLDAVGSARLIVLDSSERPLDVLAPTSTVLLREPGARKLYANSDVAVILRPAPVGPADRRP